MGGEEEAIHIIINRQLCLDHPGNALTQRERRISETEGPRRGDGGSGFSLLARPVHRWAEAQLDRTVCTASWGEEGM